MRVRPMHAALAMSVLLVAQAGADARLSARAAAKLDPRIVALALDDRALPMPVSVEFADKGELGPGDRGRLLQRAEAELSEAARSRRTRAGVSPLVDWYDVPVCADYVEGLRRAGYAVTGVSRWFNRAVVRASGAALLALAERPEVARLAPVEVGRRMPREAASAEVQLTGIDRAALGATNPPADYGVAYDQLQQIGVPAVHDSGYIGTGILIAVFDEGFNFQRKHEATKNMAIGGLRQRDFVDGDRTVSDTTSSFGYSHGTWTLSTIGGNRAGVYRGPAYGAQFALARTEDSFSETPVEMTHWAAAAEWADSLGADIISSSLGYNRFDPPFTSIAWGQMDGHTTEISRAAEIAASHGILVVNSAGNEGNNLSWNRKIMAPSDVSGDSLIAVGAVDAGGVKAGFSSLGPTADGRVKPDLMARGVSTWTASASGDPNAYVQLNGTSFSCPLVAGLAACIMQARPSWPATLVIRALRETASRASTPDTSYGYGLPNGLAALRWTPDTVGAPVGGAAGLAWSGPNPLRPGASPLRFRLRLAPGAAPGDATLRIYDAQGRMRHTLWRGRLFREQTSTVTWDGRGDGNASLPAGMYFVALDGAGPRAVARVALVR